jgi:predicted nucleic acid-binding protein
MLDCMIASVAKRHQATLLAADATLSRVASLVGIDLGEASLIA